MKADPKWLATLAAVCFVVVAVSNTLNSPPPWWLLLNWFNAIVWVSIAAMHWSRRP